jgi:hypothetical protein
MLGAGAGSELMAAVETFVLRIHVSGRDAEDARIPLRGVVRHVTSGDEVTFHDPARLLEFVESHVGATDRQPTARGT